MTKKIYYFVVVIVVFIATATIVIRYGQRQNRPFELLERNSDASVSSEWIVKRNYATLLLEKIKQHPEDVKSMVSLCSLFIQEARVSGNYVYYDQATLAYVNRILALDSLNFEGLTFKSLIYLSQHHFAEGLAIAEKAQKLNPFNAFIYGLLVDGNVEMGRYDSAVANAARMVSIRPDIRSYSRISYLREIYGDYAGAINAMKMAVSAGRPGDEPTEWSRTQLGRLYENTGDLDHAAMHYAIAINERPAYPYAMAGLARIAMAEKNYAKGIAYYIQAASVIEDYSIQEDLIDAYRIAGQNHSADSLAKLVVAALTRNERQDKTDENIGHYADRELAFAYIKVNDFPKALEHALLEYNRRPDNIDANETVAWAYYRNEEVSKAIPYLEAAMKTKSRNPALLCRAGLIYGKSNDRLMAKPLLTKAMYHNPVINPILQRESQDFLRTLQ
jgi:tetratricopeptide (TPR) repeat protein